MQEGSDIIRDILRRDPEVAQAVDEVDRALIRASLKRTPLERARVATSLIRALRRFKRVASEGS